MVIQKHFVPFLKPKHTVYKTCKTQADGVFLKVLHFATTVHKSTKHFGLSFAYDAAKICNDLSDDVRSATSFHSYRKKLKTYPLCTSISILISVFPVSLRGADPLCLRLMIIVFCFFCLVCLESVYRWRLSTIKILYY